MTELSNTQIPRDSGYNAPLSLPLRAGRRMGLGAFPQLTRFSGTRATDPRTTEGLRVASEEQFCVVLKPWGSALRQLCSKEGPRRAGDALNPPRWQRARGKKKKKSRNAHLEAPRARPSPSPRTRGTGQGGVYLSEVDGFVFGNAVGVFAGEHPAVAAVHLLRDFL